MRCPRQALVLFAVVLAAGVRIAAAASPPAIQPPVASETAGSGGSSLSQRLDRSGGVVHPPAAIDAAIAHQTPSAGRHSTPVVPPPGTPGGDPDVIPK